MTEWPRRTDLVIRYGYNLNDLFLQKGLRCLTKWYVYDVIRDGNSIDNHALILDTRLQKGVMFLVYLFLIYKDNANVIWRANNACTDWIFCEWLCQSCLYVAMNGKIL